MAASIPSIYELLGQAITPRQRYEWMRQFATENHYDIMTNKWFILFMASTAFLLTIVLLAVRRVRIIRDEEKSSRRFNHEANRRGLTAEEREILSGIAERASLKRLNSVFTLPSAFDRGSAKLMQEVFAEGQDLIQRKNLNLAVNSIKSKLGFEKTSRVFGRGRSGRRNLSSRGLKAGKRVWITPKGKGEAATIEAVVEKNDEMELVLRSDIPVLSVPGDMWNVRYRSGSAVWEFDSLTLACGIDGLELNHSDNVRYSNRRRFNRAAINRPGAVALLPEICKGKKGQLTKPQFLDCTVVEISGVGLRIKTDMNLKHGERILIIFELEEGRCVSDIAEVRGARDTALGQSTAIELIGLGDSGVNELVRVTNCAAGVAEREKSDWEDPPQDVSEDVQENVDRRTVLTGEGVSD